MPLGIPTIGSWTANDGAFYAESDITTDAQVKATVTKYEVAITSSSLQRLLDVYPESDFTFLLRPNEKATAQYYRAAQINRDLWFTCPVIDFTWQYARFGKAPVRLYEMNQTRFDPIYRNIGHPEWRVSHLADLPYFFNEELIGGGDNSPAEFALSKLVSGSVAAYAHTGDPTNSPSKFVLKDWPLAYQVDRSSNDYPQSFKVEVIGGPTSGPQTATLTPKIGHPGRSPPVDVLRQRRAKQRRNEDVRNSQQDPAQAWERTLERCNFINSITKEIGV